MDSLDQIATDILQCQRCELRMNATCPVPGHGELGARYLLVGESPGREEDEQGVPFVGAAGRRLNKLLELARISINDCFFSNVCRCRPPQNRDPRKKEIKACVEFLWREIRLVKPQYLIALGSIPLGLFCPYGIRQCHGTQMEVEIPNEQFYKAGTQEEKAQEKARILERLKKR